MDAAVPPVDTADPGEGAHADPESVARTIVLSRLTARPRTRAELEQTLAKKLVPAQVTRGVLDRFEKVGLVDDAAFARSWVDARQNGRGLARRALAQELRQRGVDDEVARAALDRIDPEHEVDLARSLVRRKLRSTRGLERQARVRRLAAMLARRGYPPGVAIRVVREEIAADGEDAGDFVLD